MRRTVSAHPVVSAEDKCSARLIAHKPVLIPAHVSSAKLDVRLLGVLGTLVVTAILGSGVYFVVMYLL